MLKNLVIALRFIPRRIINLLVIAGLTYLIYPWASMATSWRQASAPSTTMAISPADTLPSFVEPVVIIDMPTSENPIIISAQMTAATTIATPVRTRTPTSQVGGTQSSSTPVNQATADYLNALATADASLNLTATPAPPIVETTAPLTPRATDTATPSPTSIAVVIVTETPTPQNIITVAALAARATAVATSIGTYTPMPFNWVVPIVITPKPATAVPLNTATAIFQAAEATAAVFVNGTATATPVNLWTATPTPFMRPVIGEVATPWIPPTPTATPLPIPQVLVGKILFLSNRSGGPKPLPEPLVYVIDPDGSNLAVLNDDTFYQTALARDSYSADRRYLVFTSEVRRYDLSPGAKGAYDLIRALFTYDYDNQMAEQITFFGAGEAWDPVWSPTREQIALVSDDSQFAEIWIINADGSGPLQLTEIDETLFASQIGKNTFVSDETSGHPSWSPDGSKIVFWSNHTGLRQIWVMDADGTNAHTLSTTGYDDWGPVWIKYTDSARPTPVLFIDGK